MGWHQALDMQLDTLKWANSAEGIQIEYFFTSLLEKNGEVSEEYIISQASLLSQYFRTSLYRGDTIFITTEMQHLLLQAAEDLPSDYVVNIKDLLTPNGYMLFEETIYGEDINGKTVAMNGLSWTVQPVRKAYGGVLPDTVDEPTDLAVLVFWLTPSDDDSDAVNQEVIPLIREKGHTIPPQMMSHYYPLVDGVELPVFEDQGADLVCGMLKLFIAMNLLSHQPIGEPQKIRFPRGSRKRYSHEFPDRDEPMLTLITLRRKSVKSDGEHRKIEYSHRFLVRGHWRKHWYPSLGRHIPKYIHEYVKGPEDKPFRTGRRVFNFRR